MHVNLLSLSDDPWENALDRVGEGQYDYIQELKETPRIEDHERTQQLATIKTVADARRVLNMDNIYADIDMVVFQKVVYWNMWETIPAEVMNRIFKDCLECCDDSMPAAVYDAHI